MRPRAEMSLYEAGEFLGPFPSGAPAIFIDTAARLGHSAAIIGGVGNDDFGRCVLDRLSRDGVCCDYVKVSPEGATAVAFVTYFRDGSRRFIFHINNTPAVRPRIPTQEDISSPRFLHIMGCSLMVNEEFRNSIFEMVELFRAQGAQITFDPNIRVELLGERSLTEVIGPLLRHSSVLFPGEKEVTLLTGEQDPDRGLKKLIGKDSIEIVVLKRGNRGCTVYTGGSKIDVPAFTVQEVDPTGAGDCFDAGFLCGLLDKKTLRECARLACAVGALNAAAFGPMEGEITPDSVKRILQQDS
jgi:sugar/nucleoside kinase (ribokinase family)